MNHLPLPHDAVSGYPAVPYVCENQQYDGGDFLTYPQRAGFPSLSLHNPQITDLAYPTGSINPEAFIQALVVFGLLHRFFSSVDLYCTDDFIEVNPVDGTKCVHTKQLAEKTQKWCAIALAWDSERKAQELSSFLLCLKQSRTAIYAVDRSFHPDFNRVIEWSAVEIAGTLERASHFALYNKNETRSTWFAASPKAGIDRTRRMLRNGWCPSDIASSQVQFQTTAARLFLWQTSRLTSNADHSGCSDVGCKYLQVDLQTYQTQHVEQGCTCGEVGPDPAAIAKALQDGTFPIISITGVMLEDIQVEAIPYDDQQAYVAFSHVWADGLGNPWSNKLPRCQLLRLHELVRELYGRSFKYVTASSAFSLATANTDTEVRIEDRKLYIWCNTLCCPVANTLDLQEKKHLEGLKAMSIAKLPSVYRNAAFVIVLDRTLEAVYFSKIDAREAAIRLLTSRWMRRLWTYQEGGLARKLLIRFAYQSVDLQALWDEIRPMCDVDVITRGFTLEIANRLEDLRSFFDQPFRSGKRDYRRAVRAIRSRMVSVPADEPICIAAVFDLDLSKVGRAHLEERMKELWYQVAMSDFGISQCAIFNLLPRLTLPGFRWAPATLLDRTGEQSKGWSDYVFDKPGSPNGTLTADGLSVKLPGWRISRPLPSQQETTQHSPFLDESSRIIPVRATNGEWFWISGQSQSAPGENRKKPLGAVLHERESWSVILELGFDSDISRTGQRGILASNAGESGDTLRTAMVLWVWRADYREQIRPVESQVRLPGDTEGAMTDERVAAHNKSFAAYISGGKYMELKESFGADRLWCVD